MSDQGKDKSSGLLRGIKRILFTDVPVEHDLELNIPQIAEQKPEQTKPSAVMSAVHSEDSLGDMKVKVYQLLENLNSNTVDFFEVWNAAVEMGGVNGQNIKAAFTSLRFADKSLTKEKLLETGASYIEKLKQTITTETHLRGEELRAINNEKQQVIVSLEKEISNLNQQISMLQEKLAGKKKELENIDQKYDPLTGSLKAKIESGQVAVKDVIQEMKEVISIIHQEI